MKVKEESEKTGLKLSIQKTKIMASGSITSQQIGGETMKTVKATTQRRQEHHLDQPQLDMRTEWLTFFCGSVHMASSPITSWQIDGETMETVRDFILGLQNHCRW